MLSIIELTQRVKSMPVSLSHRERFALLQDAHILDSDVKLNRFFQVKVSDTGSLGGDKTAAKLSCSSHSGIKSN